jgi:hypothetical protein
MEVCGKDHKKAVLSYKPVKLTKEVVLNEIQRMLYRLEKFNQGFTLEATSPNKDFKEFNIKIIIGE